MAQLFSNGGASDEPDEDEAVINLLSAAVCDRRHQNFWKYIDPTPCRQVAGTSFLDNLPVDNYKSVVTAHLALEDHFLPWLQSLDHTHILIVAGNGSKHLLALKFCTAIEPYTSYIRVNPYASSFSARKAAARIKALSTSLAPLTVVVEGADHPGVQPLLVDYLFHHDFRLVLFLDTIFHDAQVILWKLNPNQYTLKTDCHTHMDFRYEIHQQLLSASNGNHLLYLLGQNRFATTQSRVKASTGAPDSDDYESDLASSSSSEASQPASRPVILPSSSSRPPSTSSKSRPQTRSPSPCESAASSIEGVIVESPKKVPRRARSPQIQIEVPTLVSRASPASNKVRAVAEQIKAMQGANIHRTIDHLKSCPRSRYVIRIDASREEMRNLIDNLKPLEVPGVNTRRTRSYEFSPFTVDEFLDMLR